MVEIAIAYDGQLTCSAIHGPSGSQLTTDAPTDNNGLGRTFSPTDLLATSLGTCMLTIMAISARKHGLELVGATVKVRKEMSPTPPRKIARLSVDMILPALIPESLRPALEAAAHACPVHKSLHPDIDVPLTFEYR